MDVNELRRRVAAKERELRERESELSKLKAELLRAEKSSAGLPELKSSVPTNVWEFKVKVQYGNRLRAITVDIRFSFEAFLSAVCQYDPTQALPHLIQHLCIAMSPIPLVGPCYEALLLCPPNAPNDPQSNRNPSHLRRAGRRRHCRTRKGRHWESGSRNEPCGQVLAFTHAHIHPDVTLYVASACCEA